MREFPMDEPDKRLHNLMQENGYSTLYAALPVSLMVTDKDGIIRGVNAYHLQNMGKGKTTEGDYTNQKIVDRRSIVAAGISDKMACVLEGVAFQEDEVHFPMLSGGGEGYFNVRGVPLTCDGEIIGAMLMSIDVTALHHAKEELRRHEEQLEHMVAARTSELQAAIAKVRILSGLIPICASCKNIRDDKGYWNQIESYLREHSDIEFTHSLCPECARKMYPEFVTDT
jgi:hypothetical protein